MNGPTCNGTISENEISAYMIWRSAYAHVMEEIYGKEEEPEMLSPLAYRQFPDMKKAVK